MGYARLRQATAQYLLTARGIECSAEQIMILNSSMQGADLIARILPEPGGQAWVENPGFPICAHALRCRGWRR